MEASSAQRLPSQTLEGSFSDFKKGLSAPEAIDEASRCLNCYDAPCIRACPTEINIPQFIGRLGTGDLKGSAQTILESNILGLSCAKSCPVEVLCEGACVYHGLNQRSVMIGRLQRYSVEQAYQRDFSFFSAGPSTGKRVALVGAGPASLSAAHELRRLGHETVIYEKSRWVGGLNTSGIAPYKMKAPESLKEIDRILKMGVQIQYECELGENLDLKQLVESHDAVFLGMGLGKDSRLEVPGSESSKVMGAVELIAKLKTWPKQELEWLSQLDSTLVVGGGNTALDIARELKALGVSRVCVSYRRGAKEMPGYAHEFKAARQEGVEFFFHTLPKKFHLEKKLIVNLQHTAVGSSDEVQLLDKFVDIEVDLVVVATGQSKLESLLADFPELKFIKGRLQVDPSTGRTGHSKIFAGGDLANGGMEVVNAVAEGKRAAQAIHEMLGAPHGH